MSGFWGHYEYGEEELDASSLSLLEMLRGHVGEDGPSAKSVEKSEGMLDQHSPRDTPHGPCAAIAQAHYARLAERRGRLVIPRGSSDDPGATEPATVTVLAQRRKRRRVVSAHPVVLEAADWETLRSLGYKGLQVTAHGVSFGTGNRSLAKALTGALDHQKVAYRDGDCFNLRRSNLVVITTYLHYRATGHYPQKLMDGRMTHQLRDGRTKTKRRGWGLTPQQRLASILHPAEPILPVKHGPSGSRRAP